MLNLIFIVLIFIANSNIQCNSENEEKVFIPTKEWQVIKPGQAIPKGLHIRINFETGLKEAKLLEENDKDDSKDLLAIAQEESNDPLTIQKDKILVERAKSIEEKYRSYLELQKSLKGLQTKSEAEIITDLLKKHKKLIQSGQSDNLQSILNIIEDLDFLAHQYDNAIEFVNQSGFAQLIYTNLNSTIVEIKQKTLRLMGSLIQNNIKPKIHVLETGGIPILLRLISIDPSTLIKSSAITTLSTLLRSFPLGQQKFLENGGFAILADFFEGDNIKIQTKIVTLASDLIIERNFALKEQSDSYNNLYEAIDWIEQYKQHNWCHNLNRLLYNLVSIDQNDHDSIEKCLTAMKTLQNECALKYNKEIIKSLQSHYTQLVENEDEGDVLFFKTLKDNCDAILVHIDTIKTEL